MRIRQTRSQDRPTQQQVWRHLTKASFAVLSYVTPAGRPRSSGVVFASGGTRLYVVTEATSWKARQLHTGDEVAVTVPIRRGGLLSLIAPIPPATISFHAVATVHPAGSVDIASVSQRLARFVPPERRDTGCLLLLEPSGSFLTYGVGVSLMDLAKPGRAMARVPVG